MWMIGILAHYCLFGCTKKKTGACGTVKKNRKHMPNINENLKKDEISFRSDDTLLALKWCDKREVFMLTTYAANMGLTGRTERETGRQKMKPTCIIDYNRCMGGVDKTDMLLSSVECIRKTTKWYKKVFFHFVDMALLNSCALYKHLTKKKHTSCRFSTSVN